MDHSPAHQPITAIIPAYNEADRIGAVLDVITTYPDFSQVIVIDDGSTDATAEVVRAYPVTYLRNQTNQGKGYALDRAVKAAHSNVIFFCDADVRGLNHAVIKKSLDPVLRQQVDMFIAMRNRKIYYLRTLLTIIPLLGGERALTKQLWQRVPLRYKHRFMIEAALNFYAKYYGKGFQFAVFPGLSQTIKEKKYGLLPGFIQRARMFYEIIKSNVFLQLTAVPHTVKTGRTALAATLIASLGVAIGSFGLLAAFSDPITFLRHLFAQKLEQDPDAPLIQFLISLAANLGTQGLVVVSLLLIMGNLFMLITSAPNLRYLLLQRPTLKKI